MGRRGDGGVVGARAWRRRRDDVCPMPVDPIGEVRTRSDAHDVARAITGLSGASGICDVTPYVECAVLLVTGLVGGGASEADASAGSVAALLGGLATSLSHMGDLRGGCALRAAADYMDSMARGLSDDSHRVSTDSCTGGSAWRQ